MPHPSDARIVRCKFNFMQTCFHDNKQKELNVDWRLRSPPRVAWCEIRRGAPSLVSQHPAPVRSWSQRHRTNTELLFGKYYIKAKEKQRKHPPPRSPSRSVRGLCAGFLPRVHICLPLAQFKGQRPQHLSTVSTMQPHTAPLAWEVDLLNNVWAPHRSPKANRLFLWSILSFSRLT